MTGWPSALAGMGLGLLTGLAASPLLTFADAEITESSGLVDAGGTLYTVNDSGSGPVLYAVDSRTGETSGTTTYSSEDVTDVEALAPGPDGDVWVGDIGDNLRRRDGVTVHRVTPDSAGDAPRYQLTYPDGPRDAETLLAHPVTGQLFLVSKTTFGGVVYAAPRRLDPDGPNRLRRFADVPGLLTDGAFWPDGRHVLLRGYGSATVLTYPGFGIVGTVDLPAQKQGEGVSVGAEGRVLLSSEGVGAEVLEVDLPPAVQAAVSAPATPTTPAGPSGEPTVTPSAAPSGSSEPKAATRPPGAGEVGVPVWVAAGGVVLAAGFALLVAVRVRARRTPRMTGRVRG